MDFHRRLVELRNQKYISQEQLAEKLYVSRQTISNWERGKTYPDINSLLIISVYFDVSLDYLIKGDVVIMKHQVSQSQLRNWLILSGILFFAMSVIFPTRYLSDSNIFSIYFPIVGMPLLCCLFQVFYILGNKKTILLPTF
ncbi:MULTISPECIES: helix-turn-helix transcriptional regulator [unclassified Streptococcus]|uniref:helix-turn-helix domain-containing protein n=1 Tax=unclassified Streptococcus TaxID=2608887 RepID=UPI000AE86E19|nr:MULTISPECIES: helix-turn-helix transcriptional regulator [unclassified Streptococcus]